MKHAGLKRNTQDLRVATPQSIDAALHSHEVPLVAILDPQNIGYHILEIEREHVVGLDGKRARDFQFYRRPPTKDDIPAFRLQVLIEHSPFRLNGYHLQAAQAYLTVERQTPQHEDRQANAGRRPILKEEYGTRFVQRSIMLGEPILDDIASIRREALKRAREELPGLLYGL